MHHCHILDHAERGMMGELAILRAPRSPCAADEPTVTSRR
jgi:hypothetical protein